MGGDDIRNDFLNGNNGAVVSNFSSVFLEILQMFDIF